MVYLRYELNYYYFIGALDRNNEPPTTCDYKLHCNSCNWGAIGNALNVIIILQHASISARCCSQSWRVLNRILSVHRWTRTQLFVLLARSLYPYRSWGSQLIRVDRVQLTRWQWSKWRRSSSVNSWWTRNAIPVTYSFASNKALGNGKIIPVQELLLYQISVQLVD